MLTKKMWVRIFDVSDNRRFTVFLCFPILATGALTSCSPICLSRKHFMRSLSYEAHNFVYFSIPLYMFSSSVKTFPLPAFSPSTLQCA